MDYKIGDKVLVTESWRAKGVIGGWKASTWLGVIMKVNRKTVEVRRWPFGNFMCWHRVSVDRVAKQKEATP